MRPGSIKKLGSIRDNRPKNNKKKIQYLLSLPIWGGKQEPQKVKKHFLKRRVPEKSPKSLHWAYLIQRWLILQKHRSVFAQSSFRISQQVRSVFGRTSTRWPPGDQPIEASDTYAAQEAPTCAEANWRKLKTYHPHSRLQVVVVMNYARHFQTEVNQSALLKTTEKESENYDWTIQNVEILVLKFVYGIMS